MENYYKSCVDSIFQTYNKSVFISKQITWRVSVIDFMLLQSD